MSAASTVLSIVELLQQILSELPPLDIVRCQRVDSTWKKLITGSPLLQYKAWLCNDYPDPTHHVRADDLIPEYMEGEGIEDTDLALSELKALEAERFNYNISKHLNPIIVSTIMQRAPDLPRSWFDPLQDMEKDGFGGYLNFYPVLLRDLRRWYKKNRATEHIWGNMSLYRPDARKIRWEMPMTGDAGIPLRMEAVRTEDPDAEHYSSDFFGNDVLVNKSSGEPLVLKLKDLIGRLDAVWDRWIDSEREEHYCSHDGGVCDLDQGIPGESCSYADNEEDGEEEEDKDDEDVEEEDEEEEETTIGPRMTMEEHIERAMIAASRFD
jgi:hypothetical protein